MSITLTNAASLSLNGSVAESDANAAVSQIQVVYPYTLVMTINYGTTSGQNFTNGTKIGSITVTVNLLTGVWASDNGLSGTFGAGTLSSIKTIVTGWRNSAESLALSNNIVSGTQVNWS